MGIAFHILTGTEILYSSVVHCLILCKTIRKILNMSCFIRHHYLHVQIFVNVRCLDDVLKVRNTSRVTFSDVVRAVRSSDPRSAVFVELMHVLLMAKTERGNEEDGDEGNISTFICLLILIRLSQSCLILLTAFSLNRGDMSLAIPLLCGRGGRGGV